MLSEHVEYCDTYLAGPRQLDFDTRVRIEGIGVTSASFLLI